MRHTSPAMPPAPAAAGTGGWRAPPSDAVRDPHPELVLDLVWMTAPGELVLILACAEGCPAVIRALLRCGLVNLLRTQRQDDGGFLITAIRPECRTAVC